MKTILRVVFFLLALAGPSHADETTTLAATGQLTAVATNTPRKITATVKIAGGSTSMVFTVSENCRFATAGIGVYGDLKKWDNVQIEYVEKEGGTNEATQITVQTPATTQPVKTTTPTKPPTKKSTAKKKK